MARNRNPALDYVEMDEHGVQLVLRQRKPGGPYHIDYSDGDVRVRKSTGETDREAAVEAAYEFIVEVAKERLNDKPTPPAHQLTIGELFDLFRKHRYPHLAENNAPGYSVAMRVVEAVWGRDLLVNAIDQDMIDDLARQRKAGQLVVENAAGDGTMRLGRARQGTVVGDYRHLTSIFSWATRKKRGPGEWLLDINPLSRLDRPAREKNPRQPISDHRRFSAMVRYADQVDSSGRLKLILYIARYTGRRRGEICQLRVSDVLFDTERVRAALAHRGDERFPDHFAEHWVHGALRWPRDANKQGLDWVAPMGPVLAAAFREYLAKNPTPAVGDVPLFPAEKNLSRSVRPDLVGRWFRQVEAIAHAAGEDVPHLHGGCWHPLRRLFRTEKSRAGFNTKAVFFIAGWSYNDPNAGNHGYLQLGPEELLEVAMHEPPLGETPPAVKTHASSHG